MKILILSLLICIFHAHHNIPKIIWTFLDSIEPSFSLNKSINRWKLFNPDHAVKVLTPTNLRNYLGYYRALDLLNTYSSSPELMRLIIKAEILYKEGGVWIDPEIVVERMNWLTSSTCAILEFTLSDGREHQILATAKNHPFITSWYNLIKNSNSVEYVEELINTIGKDYKSGIKFDSREDYLRYFGLVAGRIALEKNLQDVGVYVVEYPTLNLNGKEYVPTNRVVTMQQKVLKSGEQSFKRQNHSIYLGIDKKELNLISKPGQAQVIYGCNDVMGSEVCRARTHKAYNTKVDNMTMEETLNDIGLKEIYLINLPKNKDRLEFTRKQLDKLNLPFTLFEAVDSHKIQEAYETGKPLDSMFHPGIKMNFEKTAKFINDNPHIMQWHRIGCSLSHFSIYLTMIDKAANKDGPILILEDDVIFDWSVKEKIKQGLIEMPSDWEFFAIGSCFPRLEKIPQSNNLFKVYRMWCAHAYILRNSKVAQKLLDRGNTEIWQGADQYWNGMFETDLNAYALWPHVVSQNRENFISLLTPESKLKLFPVENPVTVD